MLFKSLIVLVLGVAIALYVNEYHVSTINNIIKSSPLLDSTITSFHRIVRRVLKSYGFTSQSTKDKKSHEEQLFTAEELKKYTDEKSGLYLAILGRVYDVSKGNKFYGSKGGYSFFTGRDASRAFVTGDFTEAGLVDDVLDFSLEDLRELTKWAKVYDDQYTYKGKLVGRYYDEAGDPTESLVALEERIELARAEKEAADREKSMLPPCNMEWNPEVGSRVWCTKMSGGIKRDWVGVPRKLFEPGSDTFRCACVNLENNQVLKKGTLREYKGCDPKATSCDLQED